MVLSPDVMVAAKMVEGILHVLHNKKKKLSLEDTKVIWSNHLTPLGVML